MAKKIKASTVEKISNSSKGNHSFRSSGEDTLPKENKKNFYYYFLRFGWGYIIIAIILIIVSVVIENFEKDRVRKENFERIKSAHKTPYEMSINEMDQFREDQKKLKAEQERKVETRANDKLRSEKPNEVAIFKFMHQRYMSYFSSPSFNPEVNYDNIVANEAARKFNITKSDALSIYMRLSDSTGI